MAGRGGRGRGGAGGGGYFNALKDNLNIAKGEKLISSQTPPPLFPPLSFKAVPLKSGDSENYALHLKQVLRHSFRTSVYVVKPVMIKNNAPTYTDTCQSNKAANDAQQWVPDWTSLPKELYQFQNKKRTMSKKASAVCPKKVKRNVTAKVDVEKTLLELENKETKDENAVDEEKKEEESEDEENEEAEIFDEEEIEEGTDYNMSYFDNGEDYLDDEDDNLDDGPVY